MMDGGSKPPKDAEELLRRYAAGQRDLRAAKLGRADLRGADLRGANLSGADLNIADLSGANLSGANLNSARLVRAALFRARLDGVDLRNADLRNADLGDASLGDADLRDVDLSGADLRDTDLRNANLSNAVLIGANLSGANLGGTNLGSARVGWTLLTCVDLSPFCDAEPPIEHRGPSIVDFQSIIRSLRSPKLKGFLQRTGLPEVFVEYDISCAESLDGSIINKMLQSTFISFGGPDEAFARRLYEALHRNGVTTFFFPEHSIPGKKLHRTMRDGVNSYDRVVLVCSTASLTRSGVLNEIEEALTREAAQNGEPILIPIRLDDYIFTGWAPPDPGTAKALRARVVADFEGADADPAKFDAGLLRLIAALKK